MQESAALQTLFRWTRILRSLRVMERTELFLKRFIQCSLMQGT